jgi:hypothetical protein
MLLLVKVKICSAVYRILLRKSQVKAFTTLFIFITQYLLQYLQWLQTEWVLHSQLKKAIGYEDTLHIIIPKPKTNVMVNGIQPLLKCAKILSYIS